MLSNNSIISVFDKVPLVSQSGKEYGYNCQVSSSFAEKNTDGSPKIDENGKRVYRKDFGGHVQFLGKAYEFVKGLEFDNKHPARVMVKSLGVSSYISKPKDGAERGNYVVVLKVFDAETPNFGNGDIAKPTSSSGMEDNADNPLPF